MLVNTKMLIESSLTLSRLSVLDFCKKVQQYWMKKAAGGVGHHVNADKREYMSFNRNQTRDISTKTGGSLKLVDKFTYLGSSVSSAENDLNSRLAKVWSAIESLSVI